MSAGVKLCVLALRLTELEAAGQQAGLSPADVHSLRKIYGNSPDDWRPFADKTIREYVRNAGLNPVPLSAELYRKDDLDALDRLVNDFELLIVDPICVLAEIHASSILWRLEAAVRRARLNFCVVYPPQLAQFTRDTLRGRCQTLLPLLQRAPPGQGAWDVSTQSHLTYYLDQLHAKQPAHADPNQVNAVAALLAGIAGNPAFGGAPRLR